MPLNHLPVYRERLDSSLNSIRALDRMMHMTQLKQRERRGLSCGREGSVPLPVALGLREPGGGLEINLIDDVATWRIPGVASRGPTAFAN